MLTSLHTHTDASKDGLGTIDRLLTGAVDKGYNTVAITDHGTMANSIQFLLTAKRMGIHAITGVESYLSLNGKRYHLTLLGDGDKGLNTLIKLNNLALMDGTNTIKLADIERYNDGLIVLSGCPSSPMQREAYSDALGIAKHLKSILKENFFVELMFVSSHLKTWERSIQLHHDLGVPLVFTGDVHFPYASDAKSQQILTSMKSGYDYDSELLYFATEFELAERVRKLAPEYLKFLREGVSNANTIGKGVQTPKAIFEQGNQLPVIENADKKLTQLVYDGMYKRNSHNVERADYELSIITRMNYSSYFLILHDLIDFARKSGITIGPGRGSGVGSYVLYLMGITDVNPLTYGLSFERFLNPDRQDYPDVDVDIDSSSRQKLLEYAHEKWNGYPVATYHTYSHKSLVHDLSRYFGLDKLTDEQLADETTFESCLFDIEEPNFKPAYDSMLGQIRHTGKHAGGIIISKGDVPYSLTTSGEKVVSWTEGTNKELTEIGVVKFDLLGLSALDLLSELEKKHGTVPNPEDCKNADEIIETIFAKGDLLGIFQFSGSQGIINFVKSVYPTKFKELIAINALYRPGALGAGMSEHYIEFKSKPRLIHPAIDDILAETYGIICYQEQFMSLFARVTDGDLAEADEARKTIVKSKPGNLEWETKVNNLKQKFVKGCGTLGIDGSTLWGEILSHARYSFNKSHSAAYSMIAWRMAYYKYHWRGDFYCAMLNTQEDKKREAIYDVLSGGIDVVTPDINTSDGNKYVHVGGKIYLPLTSVKYISDKIASEILTHRPFTDLADLDRMNKRRFNKRSRENMQRLNGLRSIGVSTYVSKEDQNELLGFSIPDKRVFAEIGRFNAMPKDSDGNPVMAGIVTDMVVKKGKKKEYTKYFLYPYNSCFAYDDLNITVGQTVAFRVQPFGHANKVLRAKVIE